MGNSDQSQRSDRERVFHNSLIEKGSFGTAGKEWWQTPGGVVRFRRRIEMLRHLTANHPGEPLILVLGCGDGEWINEISRFAKVVGIDVADQMIALLRTRLRFPDRAQVLVADAHSLEFEDMQFDFCFANSTLHHLDLSTALPEIWRVLKPGGKLVASEPNLSNPQVRWMFQFDFNRRRYALTADEEAFTMRKIKSLLAANFSSVRVSYFDFWHPVFGYRETDSFLYRFTVLLERIPLLRRVSGSLWLEAVKSHQ